MLTELPEAITNLSNLTTLGLHRNRICRVCEQIGAMTSLQVLSMQHNRITQLPTTFGRLASLMDLQLTHNEDSNNGGAERFNRGVANSLKLAGS